MTFTRSIEIASVAQVKTGRQSEYELVVHQGDESLNVSVLRRRRKTMALYVEANDRIELRAPTNCAWNDIYAFLGDKFDWIVRARHEFANSPALPSNCYQSGGHVFYQGEQYPLELIRSQHTIVEQTPESVFVACSNPANGALVERHMMNWYRQRSEEVFAERIAQMNQLFCDDRHPGALKIRKMKSRWGSCSTGGDICLNLLLIKESLPQIDFVIAHELCHLRHFAHNKPFYLLLDRVMPDWREREAKLGFAR